MLACVRHTTQRTAAFSTTARAGHNVNEAVTNILQDQAKKEAKTIAPKITTTNFPGLLLCLLNSRLTDTLVL